MSKKKKKNRRTWEFTSFSAKDMNIHVLYYSHILLFKGSERVYVTIK
jgi:hypothetical protein